MCYTIMKCATQGFLNTIHHKYFLTCVSSFGEINEKDILQYSTHTALTVQKVQHDKSVCFHASKILLCNHKMYTIHMSIY